MSPGAAALGLGLAYAVLLVGRARAARAEADRQSLRGRTRPPLPDGWREDVAVLQPILAGDPALETVLAGNLAALSEARFVWLVDDDDPVAADVAARLAAAHPGHRIRTMTCPAAPDGVNPKAFKLEIGWRACTEDVLLVLDDDARLPGASLGVLVAALEDGALACALPHHAPAGGFPSRDGSPLVDGSPSRDGLPSALLAAFIDDNAAMTYLAPLRLVGPVSINGMAYVIRRATLERLGGFAPIRHHLADDLGMATMLREASLARGANLAREANFALVQTAAPVEVRTTLAGWGAYVRQMHRWYLFATLLLSARPARVRLLAVVLQAVHPLLLWTLLGLALAAPSIGTVGTLGLVAALRSSVLRSLRERFGAGGRARPLVSLVAELLQPVHLAHATLVRTIRWRTRTYRVRALDDFAPR